MSKQRFLGSPRRRTWIGLVLALLLVATAFQVVSAAERTLSSPVAGGTPFPRIVIILGENGAISSLSVQVAEEEEIRLSEPHLSFLSSILGFDLRMQMFDAATMRALADANIQHVEVQTGPAGIAIYGNGRFLVGVKWGRDGDVSQVIRLAEAANVPFARLLIEMVPTIGADVLIELPAPAGVERIAPRAVGTALEFPPGAPSESPALALKVAGEYAADGTAYVFGKPLSEWGSLFGADLSVLDLDPSTFTLFQAANIQHLGVTMDYAGVSMLADGDPIVIVALGDAASMELAERLAQRFGIPFANLIPLAGRTGDMDVEVSVGLPAGQ